MLKLLKSRQAPPPQPLLLTILSGLHEGAVQTFSATKTLRIGAGGMSDLMLADDGLEPVHAELSFADGFATLKALHGGVALVGPGVVPAGKNAAAPLPAEFTVGGVRLRCNGPPPKRNPPWRRVGLVALVFVGLIVSGPARVPARSMGTAAGMAGVGHGAQAARPAIAPGASAGIQAVPLPSSTPSAGAQAAAIVPAALVIPPVPVPEPLRPRAMTAETAAAFLAQAVQDAGLVGVQVTVRGGTVGAAGTLLPSAGGTWQAVRETFDRRTSGRVVLANDVILRAEQPFVLAIDSVWTGNYPNIVIGGAKYLEGGVLPNGWTLDRIEKGLLSLRRGDARTTVAY